MSINQLIETTRRSFTTLTAAMNTVGQNVANAETDGYARRRVTLRPDSMASPGVFIRTPAGQPTGTGVSVESYDRVRDHLLARTAWEAHGALGAAQEEARITKAVEGLFPVEDGSLSNLLNDFWNSWADLADNPANAGVRVALRTDAMALTNALNRLDVDLTQLQEETAQDFHIAVDKANGMLEKIGTLNSAIQAARSAGTPDLTAEDRRDALVRELSSFAPVRVQKDDASYTVYINGMAAVEHETVVPLNLDTSVNPPTLEHGASGVAFQTRPTDDGKIGALFRALTQTIPQTRQDLNDLAETLVTEVNDLHNNAKSAGEAYDLFGNAAGDFFDETRLAAGTIALDAAILGDARTIAASGASEGGGTALLGDSTVALQMAALRTRQGLGTLPPTDTAENFVISMVSRLGATAEQASTQALGQDAVVEYLDAQERGVSAVSVDEELTAMVRYQQAFTASAQVLQTAQRMFDTLLTM